MKKSDKIALLKELQMDEPTFYAQFGGPMDLVQQHPELFFKYCMGGRMKKQTGGKENPWQTPGATYPGWSPAGDFIHSTTPGDTRWVTKEGNRTPFQEMMQNYGDFTPSDTLIQNDPRRMDLSDPEYFAKSISRDNKAQTRSHFYDMTYGPMNSLKTDKPDLYDQKYFDLAKLKQPVSSVDEKQLRYYSKAKLQTGGIPPEMQQAMMQQQAPAPEQGGGGAEQAMQQIAQMLQQGMPPEQIIQQLVQSGVPQEQAVQMVQQVAQGMQGEAPQQDAPAMMQTGGRMKYQLGSSQGLKPYDPNAPSNAYDPRNVAPQASNNSFNLDNTDNSKPTLNKNKGSSINYAGAIAGAVPGVINAVSNPQLTTQGKVEEGIQVVGDTVAGMIPGVNYATALSDTSRQLLDKNNKKVVNPDTGKTEVVRTTGEAMLDSTLEPQHSQDITAWTNVVSDVFTGDSTASTGDYLSTFLGGTVGNLLGDAIDGGENQDLYNKQQADKIKYDYDAQARFVGKYGGKFQTGGIINQSPALQKMNQPAMTLLQAGGIPPEMMAAMQQGAPQQTPPEPYKPGYRDISPSASIDSSLKPISYKGRTHKYGGIEVTDNSELENGEYSVNLTDPQTGAPQRYIFSNATGFAAKAKKILKDYQSQYA